MLPRIIIPGKAILPILSETVGSLSTWLLVTAAKQRQVLFTPSASGNLAGKNGQRPKIRYEAKLSEKLSTADTAISSVNLIDGDCDIGVLVLSNCCQFWVRCIILGCPI